MGRVFVRIAMVFLYAASATGLTQAEVFASSVDRPDGDKHGPADTPEPCEEESCSCDAESSDDDATTQRAICQHRLLVASRLSWGDGQVPNGHPPSQLFRPPIA